VARLVLAQPASASICERINSEFAFIKDPRRNRLQHDKANKLVAIFHNLRLLARMNKPNYVEPAVGWNCEDNHVGVIKYGVADYEPRKNSTPISAPNRPALLQPWPEDEPLQQLGRGRPAAHDAYVTVIHHRRASRAVLCIIRIILYFYIIRIMYCHTLSKQAVLRVEPKHDPRGGTIKRGGRYTTLVAKGSDKASDV